MMKIRIAIVLLLYCASTNFGNLTAHIRRLKISTKPAIGSRNQIIL